jgi:putative ABC transport system ATP-binding protein
LLREGLVLRHDWDYRGVLFELEDVCLTRNGELVLDGVTAGLREGATCVAGPSGSGKSTLLRLLNRLSDPERGSVSFRQRDVREYDVLELRREACLVPQLPALLEGTVAENVRFGPRLRGGEQEVEVERWLELAGLDASFAERDGDKLSVGEQQRVMLARALALEPKVLLLDEPTSALDEEARDAIEATLASLRERLELSIVLVTHDLEQARRLSEWVVRIDKGRVTEQGPAEEVLAQ